MSTKTNKLLSLDEFSQSDNPIFARLNYYLSDAVEEVIEEWGLENTIETSQFSGYVIEFEVKNRTYVLTQSGELKKVLKRAYEKTGQTYTGDRLIDTYKTIYTLSDALYTVEELEARAHTKDNIESVACEIINAVQDLLLS